MRGLFRLFAFFLVCFLAFSDLSDATPAERAEAETEAKPDITPTGQGFQVLWTPRKETAPRSLWGKYLGALGGLKVTVFQGWAQVSSSVRSEEGGTRDVASGDARTDGYRVSLFSAPRSSGFFIYPTADFLAQTIEIADFREAVPPIDLPSAEEIPAIVTDPETGETVDITDPNTYRLYLRSLGIGQRAGFDFVAGSSWIEMYATVEAGANLVEARHAIVRLGDRVERGAGLKALGSFVGAGRVGFTFPKAHFALSATGELKTYPQFDYPNPVEFRGAIAYDPQKEINERPREFVRGAALDTAEVTVSVSYVF
ncbi:MAG: hypothetical protein HYT87_16575 [Nitrospirae bacterium]|nr:hypothetical protein [Nitrospirota bacterium]